VGTHGSLIGRGTMLQAGRTQQLKNLVSWDIILCSLVKVNWCFKGACCLHVRNSMKQAAGSLETMAVSRQCGIIFQNLFLVCVIAHLIQEEIKRRLNSGNACYHSVQNLLYSLLSKKLKN
jgi:hypothetical protein